MSDYEVSVFIEQAACFYESVVGWKYEEAVQYVTDWGEDLIKEYIQNKVHGADAAQEDMSYWDD